VLSNYANILELLLRLRQACDHPMLTFKPSLGLGGPGGKGGGGSSSSHSARRTFSDIEELVGQFFKDSGLSPAFIESVTSTLQSLSSSEQDDPAAAESESQSECSICLGKPESPVVTPCGHIGCEECFTTVINAILVCPVCRKPCTTDMLVAFQVKVPPPPPQQQQQQQLTAAAAAEPAKQPAELAGNLRLSSKLKALLHEVQAMIQGDEESKCIVFSQFTSMLNLVEVGGKKLGERERDRERG
jgi:DNA repair protein RAD5